MTELAERGACDALDLPRHVSGATLSVHADAPMISIAPFRGRAEDVARVLTDHTGGGLPDPGVSRDAGDSGRIIWTGIGQWFLRGEAAGAPALLDALKPMAAVTDQRCAWTALRVEGADAAEVLARLVPLDLDETAFPPGTAARTLLGHMMCSLTFTDDGYDILVMRSFTLTAVHEITEAMERTAARPAPPIPH